MTKQIAAGVLLLVITTVIHAVAMRLAYYGTERAHTEVWKLRRASTRTILTAAFVLIMFLAGVVEAVVWAWTSLAVGAFEGFEPALYFSLVTYSTLGFGDIVLDPSWRVLSAIEAANGTIMFGWTTALIFWFVHRHVARDVPGVSTESRTAEPAST
jgi:hypothetical protein